MKKKLPRKTEKVLRDMAVTPCQCNCHGGPSMCIPHHCRHQHDSNVCVECAQIWAQGEKFGRENHVVKQPAPIVHTLEKEVMVYKPMPTFWIHSFWAVVALLMYSIGFAVGYPNWAGAVRP